jgi:hypothetical protein
MRDCSGEIYEAFPDFTAYLFFYVLLPPIILGNNRYTQRAAAKI